MDTARLAAVASPRRREILRLLWNQELTAGAIRDAMPDVTFGAVSLQLKVLLEAGLVECEADRQFRVYRIKREALGPVAPMLRADVERRALASQVASRACRDSSRTAADVAPASAPPQEIEWGLTPSPFFTREEDR